LTGRFIQNDNYKCHLWYTPRREKELSKVQSQITSTGQIQVDAGLNGGPVCKLTLDGSRSIQYTLTHQQRIDANFDDFKGKFEITLGLDDGIKKNLRISVAESVFFFVVLKLEEPRQPMQLELNAAVTYVSSGISRKVHAPVEASMIKEYSGHWSHDIIKNLLEIPTT